MWTAERITVDAANKFQVKSGLFLKKFSIEQPKEPAEEDIVCDTTGAYTISCVPEIMDIFEGTNNAPKNTKEGARISKWTCAFSVGCHSITVDTLKLALGACTEIKSEGVTARRQFELKDFNDLFWIGDLLDPNKLFVAVLHDSVSTGGLVFTTDDAGKGNLALTITPFGTIKEQDKIPMDFYILTKIDGSLPASETGTKKTA